MSTKSGAIHSKPGRMFFSLGLNKFSALTKMVQDRSINRVLESHLLKSMDSLPLITQAELDQYRKYWRRPRSSKEKEEIREIQLRCKAGKGAFPDAYEYAKLFDRSPHACLGFPGAVLNIKTTERTEFRRKLFIEEIKMAIEWKRNGRQPSAVTLVK